MPSADDGLTVAECNLLMAYCPSTLPGEPFSPGADLESGTRWKGKGRFPSFVRKHPELMESVANGMVEKGLLKRAGRGTGGYWKYATTNAGELAWWSLVGGRKSAFSVRAKIFKQKLGRAMNGVDGGKLKKKADEVQRREGQPERPGEAGGA